MKTTLFFVLLFAAIVIESETNLYAATIDIQPKDTNIYDNWLPENGNTLALLVSVTGAASNGEIQFRFTEVSNWAGTCMNADAKQDICIYDTEIRKLII